MTSLPYRAEYSKSSRAECRKCNVFIAKEALRFAHNVKSRNFDGVEPQWYHSNCFFVHFKGGVTAFEDVDGADALRWEHQQALRKFIVRTASGVGQGARARAGGSSGEFGIEYAASSRSVCKGCLKFILKGDVRCSKQVRFDGGSGGKAKVPAWHHVKCFVKRAWFPHPMEMLPGWGSLDSDHQQQVLKLAQEVRDAAREKRPAEATPESHPSKRARGDEESSPGAAEDVQGDGSMDDDIREAIQLQTESLWKINDGLKTHCTNKQLKDIYTANGQDPAGLGEQALRDLVADAFLFGAMPRCPTCNSSTLRYGNGQYTCHGDISEWSKCTFKTRDVVRNPAPYRLPLDIELPQSCRPTDASCRFDRVLPRSDSPKAEGSTTEPHGIFSGMTLMLVGKLEGSKTEWTKKIEEAGGVVVGSVDASVDCVVTNAAWMQREVESGRLYKARKMLVPVVGEGFLTEAFDAGRLNIAKFTLPGYEPAAGGDDRRMGDPAIRTVNVKGQVEVHEDSGLQQTGHVLQENKHVYHATMTLSDQATGANSFYTLQVIQRNGAVGERGCYLFRAWGRVGDSRVGNHKLEDMLKYEAVDRFIELFEDKSGNSWQSWMANKGARKIAGKYYPIELDYGQDNVAKAKVVQERLSKNAEQAAAESDLDPKTIELLQMLFDMQTYRSALLEMDINADQMPLGKLSKSHIEQGFNLLTEIQSLLAEVDGEVDAARRDALVLDASNRFNTIVPQRTPALIDSMSQLSSKVAMVDALRNMEVAANMLVGDCPDTSLVQNYTRLGCQIEPLADPQEIQMIDKWLQNGRGPTHKEWTLELQDVFAVDRDGERVRFQPFKALPNRMLLFHGSRISNFVGILSQGARIAPKEAPSTGYMFGKGVYFADVPTKSAQYCFPTRANPHGLLLVCEVALGRTHDVREAQFMDAPPRGRHSTRALGKHMPDTLQEIITPDGTKIPCGTPIHNQEVIDKGTELMYNEYVVYDTSQVRMKYLLKVRFNYNKK